MINRRQFTFLCGSAVFGQTPTDRVELDWHDATKLTVEGLGFSDVKSPYDRLPARAEGVVRQAVWDLSRDSAGVLVRFTANTPLLRARWTLTKTRLAGVNMTAIAASGLDLYTKTGPGKWRWLGVGRPSSVPATEDVLANGLPKGDREYTLYLPLFNGVTSLEVGVPKGTALGPGSPRPAGRKPIVFYGTSITHGASASRAGMTHVAILGRMFDRPVINLGFSGNGRMELEMTKLLAELDPAVFVLDCLPNMTAKVIEERAEACVKLLRGARPSTPILLVEDRNYPNGFLIAALRERNETNHAAMRAVYERLRQANTGNLHYLKADDLLGEDGEGTTDGSHPNDLGFVRQAQAFAKPLRKLLK
ncbi:MAG: SGNH/GDSL hydrolase family protein [Bryobacteraceae bacterium]